MQLTVCAASNPRSLAAADLLADKYPDGHLGWDHLAFRTVALPGLGIASLAPTFKALGWVPRDDLTFPAKKLRARWYAPPDPSLPRVFISELAVDDLSSDAARAVHKVCGGVPASLVAEHYLSTATVGSTPWPAPSYQQYQTVAAESEYGGWVLVNGGALNHTTLAVHAMDGMQNLNDLICRLEAAGFSLNREGGAAKISPDGLLCQASTIADQRLFRFSCGAAALVPASYIEFAERKVLPEFAHLPSEQVREEHRREGFEVGNADKIFESTFKQAAA